MFMTDMPVGLRNLFTIILGLIVGSFTNVLIHRIPRQKSIISPGSQCPDCGIPVRWKDNIPVLSYLYLRGRCRGCKVPISIRYPVVELLTALLYLAVKIKFGWGLTLFIHDFPFVTFLIAITFIDLDHRIIPDVLSLSGLVLGLATSWWVTDLGILRSAAGAAIGFAVFLAFAWLYQRMARRSGLGGGDIKLLAMLGAFVGPAGVFCVVLVSSILGSVIGIGWAVLSKQKNMMTVSIPYGPFLVLGALYYYLLGDILWLPFTTLM